MIDIQIKENSFDGCENVINGYLLGAKVISCPEFIDVFKATKKFTYTKMDTRSVISIFADSIVKSAKNPIIIKSYYYKNPSVIGMTRGDGIIWVNTNGAKFRTKIDYACNFCHEFGHYPMGFGHGSNFPPGFRARMMGDFQDKNLSVPYILDKICKLIIQENGEILN